MTVKSKTKDDEHETESETTEETASTEETRVCDAPHFLPMLTHLACTEPAPDPDRPPGAPGHQHRHQDGDAIYTWD